MAREAVGELPTVDTDRTRLVSIATDNPATSDYVESSVVAAFLEEISALERPRPGLVAVALSLAAVLDNPRATSSKPPAAGALVNILNQLRKSAQGGKRKLTSVRQMTARKGG